MRGIHGVIAVPIGALLLLAAVGCSNTAAAAPPAASSTTGAGTGASTATSTSAGTTGTGTASATPTEAPFPGIWDITTWAQYRTAQAAVLQGHQPWLLDPALVVSAWAAGQGSQPAPTVHKVSTNVFTVVEPGTHITYTVRGTCPDPRSSAPIWVITSITHD